MDKIMRLKEVLKVTGHGRSTWYTLLKEGRVPRSVQLGDRNVGWFESEIQQYIEDLRAKRDDE